MNWLERKIVEREMNKMLKNISAHPKTTIIGALLAAAGVLANNRSWGSIAIAAFTAILGALSQDPAKQ
jgi:hypothetical protein